MDIYFQGRCIGEQRIYCLSTYIQGEMLMHLPFPN